VTIAAGTTMDKLMLKGEKVRLYCFNYGYASKAAAKALSPHTIWSVVDSM
jgi:hypothetical protein